MRESARKEEDDDACRYLDLHLFFFFSLFVNSFFPFLFYFATCSSSSSSSLVHSGWCGRLLLFCIRARHKSTL
jgi:hypothetical protein